MGNSTTRDLKFRMCWINGMLLCKIHCIDLPQLQYQLRICQMDQSGIEKQMNQNNFSGTSFQGHHIGTYTCGME